MKTKTELIDDAWDNWDLVMNEYIDSLKDLFDKDMKKKTKKEIEELIKEYTKGESPFDF